MPELSPRQTDAAYRRTPHLLALAAAAFTWPLLMLGGTVTILRAGMAVPDWPSSFGINMFLFNLFDATWGVFVEHGHRLYGSLVGLASLGLAGYLTIDRLGRRGLGVIVGAFALAILAVLNPVGLLPSTLKPVLMGLAGLGVSGLVLAGYFGIVRRDVPLGLAWFGLASVVGQGVLGGYRVNLNSPALALAHGCLGQAVFGLYVGLAVVTGRRWIEAPPARLDSSHLRWLTTAMLLAVYGQIVAGACVRHLVTTAALLGHAGSATAVVGLAGLIGSLVWTRRSTYSTLIPATRILLGLVMLQVALGVANWWTHPPFDGVARPEALTKPTALIRLGHQGAGALLLAASLVLCLRAWRALRSEPMSIDQSDDREPAAARPRQLEAVR